MQSTNIYTSVYIPELRVDIYIDIYHIPVYVLVDCTVILILIYQCKFTNDIVIPYYESKLFLVL